MPNGPMSADAVCSAVLACPASKSSGATAMAMQKLGLSCTSCHCRLAPRVSR